ncbi:hypothetical protein [Anaerotignum sp. MB30-C6]|uniref:hypothetical protein n=1 Tax=Anaerotignum sp. MB30-C6 TaxID=3070814 RepID=UPI0027DE3048|nr:hypothetical protein [Anaerotignum sp. MB30-C6]WMI80532.1 hypothetical protein RBQ60_11935 [Anaerotignum sp. MB30-C6]
MKKDSMFVAQLFSREQKAKNSPLLVSGCIKTTCMYHKGLRDKAGYLILLDVFRTKLGSVAKRFVIKKTGRLKKI